MNEYATRKVLIDKAMEKAGWRIGKTEKFNAREEFVVPLPDGKNQFVDYCFMHNGKVLAVVEAKRINRGVEQAREQARQYADNVQAYVQPKTCTVHFLHQRTRFTSGMLKEVMLPRKSGNYPTPDDLQYMMWRRETRPP